MVPLPPYVLKALLIFFAGGVGSVCRYWIAGAVQRSTSAIFPFGTLVVNVAGCFLIGFLVAALSGRWMIREEFRVMVLVGFLGGFTTFSAFAYETFSLVNAGSWTRAGLNIALSVVSGFAAVWIGYRLAERWIGV